MVSRKLVFITIVFTFLLLLLGGLVHNTNSSLACPDWPLCYGQVFPEMKGGVLIEHSHRLLASFIGLLTIIAVFFSFRDEKKGRGQRPLFKYALLSLFLVIIQGLLGGITVIYKLPTIVSTTHLGVAMIFLASLVYLYQQTLSFEGRTRPRNTWKPEIKHLLWGVLALLYSQMLLGAFLRHSGAGASCGLGLSNSLMCFDFDQSRFVLWPSFIQAKVHILHRYFGVGVFIAYLYVFKRVFSFKSLLQVEDWVKVRFWLYSIFLTFIIQLLLGILSVSTYIAVIPTTLHLGFAALIFASLYKLILLLYDLERAYMGGLLPSFASDLFELTKPKLSLLVVSTTFVGMYLAPGELHFFKSIEILFWVALVVTGAAAYNCYLEREIDAKMERTRDRALPAGRLSPQLARNFSLFLISLSLPGLVLRVNMLSGLLAALAAVTYLYAYTPMKLRSPLAVYIGAIPGALPSLIGWAAVQNSISTMAWLIFAIMFVWQIPHFLSISLYCSKDYEMAGIKVYPNEGGVRPTQWAVLSLTGLVFMTSLMPYFLNQASANFYVASIFVNALFLLVGFLLFFQKDGHQIKIWAKRYFWGSIFYLPLVFGALIFLV